MVPKNIFVKAVGNLTKETKIWITVKTAFTSVQHIHQIPSFHIYVISCSTITK